MPKQLGDVNLYTIKELSSKLGVTAPTLRRYLKAGKLTGRKLGVKYMITEDSVRKYFEEGIQGKK